MKRSMAAVAVALTAALTGCDAAGDGDGEASASAVEPRVAEAAAPPASAASAEDRTVAAAPTDTPAFAVIYPGGAVQDTPMTADGPAGPGGLVTFTTDAQPDAVVDFYRRRAEAAGLASVTAMTQGEARAYSAAAEATGASLQIVAAPEGEGATSVQLAWSAGQ